jgi:hypothetical protein
MFPKNCWRGRGGEVEHFSWHTKIFPDISLFFRTSNYFQDRPLQSNRMFSCEQHCNIVPQYCNFDRQIALSNLQPTRTNCKLKFTNVICKQSLWLDYKKEGSTNPVAQTIWLASHFLVIQSEALFANLLWISNLQFVRVGCNLLRAICPSKLQYYGTILQCCSQENIRFDCNIWFKFINLMIWFKHEW